MREEREIERAREGRGTAAKSDLFSIAPSGVPSFGDPLIRAHSATQSGGDYTQKNKERKCVVHT